MTILVAGNIVPSEFLRASRLVPNDQELLCVPPDTAVKDALALMQQHNFDQLPVKAADQIVGVFSYRSLAQGLHLVRAQDDPMVAPIRDLLEDLEYVRATDRVERILELIDRDGAVLIGDDTDLKAVATAEDVTRFLWSHTQPFMLLEDIELAIREAMRLVRNPEELTDDIRHAFSPERRPPSGALEDLTMGELLMVVKGHFASYRVCFGHSMTYVNSTLDPVVGVRNKVFHFRGEVTVEELEQLKAAHIWLLRRLKMIRAER